MEKTFSKEFRKLSEKIHNTKKGLPEEELEKQCFLSIINEIKDSQIKMFELGAETGRMSLILAGIIDFNLIPSIKSKTYRCLVLEAEPTHYTWLVEHFRKQNINIEAIHGAASDKSDYVNFDVSLDLANCYGQAVIEGNGYRVKSFTVDELINKYNFSKVNIAHVDVQGNEINVLLGSKKVIQQGMVDYWIIGTHERFLEEEIIEFTKDLYDVILYIPKKSGLIKHDFCGQVFIPQDDLLILRHKKLTK